MKRVTLYKKGATHVKTDDDSEREIKCPYKETEMNVKCESSE